MVFAYKKKLPERAYLGTFYVGIRIFYVGIRTFYVGIRTFYVGKIYLTK